MAIKEQNKQKKSKELTQKIQTFTKKGFSRKQFVIAIVVLLVGFLLIRRSTSSKFEVDVQTVKRQRFVDSILASGEVIAEEAIKLNFETGGTVAEVAVKLGQVVKKGDLIAKLDTTNLYSTYLSAEADLRAKEAALNSVYDDLQGNESTETFAEISTRTATETNKDKAYRAFVIASRNLSGATLRAPFDGIIASMPEGLATGVNITLPTSYQFSVVNPETIYFITEVNELDIPRLTSNLKVKIALDAYPGEEYEGVIEGMAFSSIVTSTGGSAFPIRVTLPGQNALKFRVGMNGDAEFIVSEKTGQLLIPQTALIEENGNTYSWIIEGGKAKKVSIEIGASSVNDVEIVSGVNEEDTVIIRPPSDLEDGDRVSTSE